METNKSKPDDITCLTLPTILAARMDIKQTQWPLTAEAGTAGYKNGDGSVNSFPAKHRVIQTFVKKIYKKAISSRD